MQIKITQKTGSTSFFASYVGCVFQVKGWKKGNYIIKVDNKYMEIPAYLCEVYDGEPLKSELYENRRKLSTWLAAKMEEAENHFKVINTPNVNK